MPFCPELALTRLQLAELLLEHYPADKKEALEHLDFAIKEFREMKMQPSLERALERVLLTFAEAQEFLRVSHQTLYKLTKEGLSSHKIGSKRMFLKEDLLNWIQNH